MRIPKYRKHSTGHAFYEHAGERTYLPGAHNSPESLAAYRRFISELLATAGGTNGTPPPILAVLSEQWLAHCEIYYGGTTSTEYQKCFYAVRAIEQYALLPPAKFGPKKLKEIQKTLAARKLTRNYINAMVSRIKQMFQWAVSEELIDASIHHALSAVRGVPRGRTAAKESVPREPVPWEHVLPVLAQVSPTIRTMILLQHHTGVRGKSIRLAKKEQFKIDVEPWQWRPQHKMEHQGKELVVFLGPQARKLLAARLDATPAGGYLFRPTETRRSGRYGKFYGKQSYTQAVERGIERANRQRAIENELLPEKEHKSMIPHWTPHQLRHAKGTSVRAKHGLEAAQAVLGHGTMDATQIYAQRQMETASRIAEEEG